MIRFEINPPHRDYFNVPPGVGSVLIEAGLWNENELDEAIGKAVSDGLIMPRHLDSMALVPADRLEYREYGDNLRGWRLAGEGKCLLCFIRDSGMEARLPFSVFRKWCKMRDVEKCELCGERCMEMNCEPWREEFRLKQMEKGDYGG